MDATMTPSIWRGMFWGGLLGAALWALIGFAVWRALS